jgi:polar amino acid transport system substrate-binding protein
MFPRAWPRRLLAALVLLAAPCMALAEPIRICISDTPYPPFMFPDREGAIQWLLKHAALRAQLDVEFHAIPIKRCLAEMASGKMAARMAGNTPLTRASLKFPGKGKEPDPERALGAAREMVFRAKDSKLDWDGHQFLHLNGTVLMQPGFAFTESLLRPMHVVIDDGGKTLEVNIGKLMAGRGAAVIGYEFYAPFVLARPEFNGKVEMLPIPVHEATYYLAFAPDYYRQHAAEVERLWTAAAEVRRTPAYEAFKQSVIDATLEEVR